MQGSLQNLWSSIGSLQLIVHLPLNAVVYPAHVQTMFEQLIKVVQFDLLEFTDAFQIQITLDVTETDPYSVNFDDLGYGSQNTYDNLGFTNFIIITLLIENIIFVVGKTGMFARCPRIQRRLEVDAVELSAANMQFVIMSCMELFICCMVAVVPNSDPEWLPSLFYLEEWDRSDKFAAV